MATGKLYVGTSGWSYRHWANGRFYPHGLKPGDWLAYFARHFKTVEINCSFYRLPAPSTVSRWSKTVGPEFCFAVKLWRRITHEKRLVNCEDDLRRFVEATGFFGARRGPLLIQLPPSMKKDAARLKAFLDTLAKTVGRPHCRTAVEFRNQSWLCDEISELLSQSGAALVLADTPKCAVTQPNNVGFVYIRRHGPGDGYHGRYTPEHIARDAQSISQWRQSGRDVHVYYNNDIEGYAIDNANQLVEAIEHTK